MSKPTVACQRCGAALRAVAFMDLNESASSGDFDVYCGPCSKILEREALRSWATKWARSLVSEDQRSDFFDVLGAVWAQGFLKARTFEEAREVFTMEDNPFHDDGALIDPLHVDKKTVEAPGVPEVKPILDEDEYYDANPIFGRDGA